MPQKIIYVYYNFDFVNINKRYKRKITDPRKRDPLQITIQLTVLFDRSNQKLRHCDFSPIFWRYSSVSILM